MADLNDTRGDEDGRLVAAKEIRRVSSPTMARRSTSRLRELSSMMILPPTISLLTVPSCSIDPRGFSGYRGSTKTMKCEQPIELFTWSNWPWLQTDPCGVEAMSIGVRCSNSASYRRTLVGSKLGHPHRGSHSPSLQTDPCGVEASVRSSALVQWSRLQTDPCGVEASQLRGTLLRAVTLQTDPCGVEA